MDGDVAEQIHAVNGDEQQDQQDVEEQTEQDFYSDEQHVDDDSAGDEIKRSIDDDNRDSSTGKLFVGGVAWETTEETFASYFSKYGEITDSVIMIDKLSGRPRGFGFVTFSDPAVADKVIEEEHVIDGRAVEVKRTVPREDMQVKGDLKTRKIFIGGIPPSFTEDELKEYFSSYGNIAEHQIMLDHKTGRSRGFGFVTFENEDAVENIFFDGKTHELGGKQVEIKKAEPRRPASDFAKDSRLRHGGGSSKSYGGFGSGAAGYGGAYGGKMGRGYGGYGGYGSYGGYGGYGGNYGGGSASFYGGYGGYGQGFGFGGPMYGAAGYGGGSYGSGGYGAPGGYSGAAGYGGGSGYGTGGGGVGGGVGFGGGKGYGSGSGYGGSKGYGNGGGATGRHHPYRK